MSTALAQSLSALELANATRTAMAQRRAKLRALPPQEAAYLAADWLEDPDDSVARMRLDYLLRSIPRFGHVRIRRLVTRIGSPQSLTRRIGPGEGFRQCDHFALGDRQRRMIAAELRRIAGGTG